MIQFPDISHYQGNIDLTGAQVVVAKATQGATYTDPLYGRNKAEAARVGALFVAYHWLDTSDAGAQARHAFAVVGADVPLMIDDEQGTISVPHTLAFVDAYRTLGGLVALEYAPRWVWWKSGQPDLRPFTAAGLHLVSSSYPQAGYTATGPGWAPYGGVTPTIWQYTDARPFNGQRVDFNAYRGSADQLRALLYGTAQPREDDMKLFRAEPSGAVWVSNGPQRWHIPDVDSYHKALKLWGLTAADVIPIADGDEAGLGQDVTAGAGGLIPHEHTIPAGTTGPAVPEAA